MDLGWSGFTPVGYLKVGPTAVADYVEANGLQGNMRFNLFIGAEIEDRWASLKITDKRWPYQTGGTRAVFRMVDCRVQSARKRKGLPDFPCKSVGIVEYAEFAKTIDPKIETRCLACPPDEHPEYFYCAWEFALRE